MSSGTSKSTTTSSSAAATCAYQVPWNWTQLQREGWTFREGLTRFVYVRPNGPDPKSGRAQLGVDYFKTPGELKRALKRKKKGAAGTRSAGKIAKSKAVAATKKRKEQSKALVEGMAGLCRTRRGTVRVQNDYSVITKNAVFAQQQGATALVQHQQQMAYQHQQQMAMACYQQMAMACSYQLHQQQMAESADDNDEAMPMQLDDDDNNDAAAATDDDDVRHTEEMLMFKCDTPCWYNVTNLGTNPHCSVPDAVVNKVVKDYDKNDIPHNEVDYSSQGVDEKLAKVTMEKNEIQKELNNAREDYEDKDELLKQQALATDIWQGRIDELGEHALAAGVDPKIINEIRFRPLSSGR